VHNIGENELNEKITTKIEGGPENLAMKMTIYAPQVFKILVDNDSSMIDPVGSLDPTKNQTRIMSFKNPDGGKSGEFFFFTEDNKLILKTMTDAELSAFLKRLGNYFAHVTLNDTMISIIYGVFSFERLDVRHLGYP
jgi:1-phosphatidylinositol-4-phosphate 5-kinase